MSFSFFEIKVSVISINRVSDLFYSSFQRNMRDFVPELKKYTEEQWTKWRMDSVIPRLPGDYEILWKFDTKKSVQDWITTVDSDHNEGFSRAQFEFGKNNTGIFHGYVDVTLPKDGRTDYAGYANIRGPELFVST